MTEPEVIEADLTWTGDVFERGIQIVVNEGRIESAGRLELSPTRRLTNRAILPGMVSAHSHAFQRALRGHGETFAEGAGNFWSWREAMYGLVQNLDDERFLRIMRGTFAEMLSRGITTVGEFHYLHHSTRPNDYALDELVLRAAAETGIRMVLLLTYYKTGTIGQPLSEAQARFETRSLDEFWSQVDALAPRLDARTQTLGVAAHSIRGVPLEEIEPLYREARSRSMPFHMHVEEQRREIEECGAAYGATPMHLINERLDRADGFTAVHATHTEPAELQRFLEKGGGVCITPLTEANLGDGIPAVIPTRLSLGSDSNARISMLEEMRWLEYAQRLKSETRGVYRDTKGRNAPRLFEVATAGGARALDVASGTITPGALADFFVIDLQSQSIAEVRKENLLAALVFGSGDETIVATCVGGVWTER